MLIRQIIHPSVDGHPPQDWGALNKPSMHNLVRVSSWAHELISFQSVPSNGIAMSQEWKST